MGQEKLEKKEIKDWKWWKAVQGKLFYSIAVSHENICAVHTHKFTIQCFGYASRDGALDFTDSEDWCESNTGVHL